MSISFLTRGLLPVLLAAAVPMAVVAQQDPAAPPTEAQEQQLEAWYTELQEIHQTLQSLQQQALADAELAATQQELGSEIQLAMAEIDPSIEERLSRMQALESEAATAQQEGNVERLQTLMQEASGIQEHFAELQEQVLQEPTFAAKLSTFQEQLQQKMLQLNPEAEAQMDRLRELETRLTEAMGGAR